ALLCIAAAGILYAAHDPTHPDLRFANLTSTRFSNDATGSIEGSEIYYINNRPREESQLQIDRAATAAGLKLFDAPLGLRHPMPIGDYIYEDGGRRMLVVRPMNSTCVVMRYSVQPVPPMRAMLCRLLVSLSGGTLEEHQDMSPIGGVPARLPAIHVTVGAR
ncbi:MAG: hypothetical protein QOJ65_1144, partial [Fimbriimonadaceae bacterium]|nr:hypothetical protein [Fimbriimonadaceae bacterium]